MKPAAEPDKGFAMLGVCTNEVVGETEALAQINAPRLLCEKRLRPPFDHKTASMIREDLSAESPCGVYKAARQRDTGRRISRGKFMEGIRGSQAGNSSSDDYDVIGDRRHALTPGRGSWSPEDVRE